MNTLITILIILGVICAVVLILLSVFYFVYIIRNKNKPKVEIVVTDKETNTLHFDAYKKNNDMDIQDFLNKLLSSKNGAAIAASFLALVSLPYVLIHILINKGEKYSDSVQKKNYCNSLTPDIISRINSVEGKYE